MRSAQIFFGVIKHNKATSRVKAELPDLWKKKNVWQSGIGSNILLKTRMTVLVSAIRFGILPLSSANQFNKKCYSWLSRNFLITTESNDEQRPILVSAHSPPKIRWKLPFTEPLIPQPQNMLHSFPGWQRKDICHMHFFLVNNPAYGRQRISLPMWIVGPIQF